MIRNALSLLARALNGHLQRRFNLDEEAALLSTLIDQDGTVPERNKNRVIISLIHLDQETNKPYNIRNKVDQESEKTVKSSQPVKFNLNIICASYFNDYEESLKFLSETIAYFQDNDSFDTRNTPGFPTNLDRLNLEVESIDYTEFHNIWTAIGAKYVPSILYKARLVSFGGMRTEKVGEPVAGVAPELF